MSMNNVMEEFPLALIRSSLLSQFPNAAFAMSSRQGEAPDAPYGFNLGYGLGDDDARVTNNISRFAEALGLEAADLAMMKQVHGDTIRDISEPGLYENTDAMITRHARIGLTVRSADCVPVVLYAPNEQIVAVVHAGWRGSAARVTLKTVQRLVEEFRVDTAGLFAFIAPSAGRCCYQVGADVAGLFPEAWVDTVGEHHHLDLKGLNAHQLEQAGVRPDNIEIDGLCTIHNETLFHSWRRDGEQAGRMLATIYLKGEL